MKSFSICLIFALCVAHSVQEKTPAVSNSARPAQPLPYQRLQAEERDGAHHGSGSSHSTSFVSHSASGGSGGYGAPSKAGDDGDTSIGYYYYYYPVTAGSKAGGIGGGQKRNKGFFSKMFDSIMTPMMYPLRRMYSYFNGRSLSGAPDFVPVQMVEKVMTLIEEEVMKEECLPRMICQLGKQAEGYDTFIELFKLGEYFVEEEYQTYLSTFKHGTNKKTNCKIDYKCTTLDTPLKN